MASAAKSCYLTHFNGGRPFKLEVSGSTVNVYPIDPHKEKKYSSSPVLTLSAARVFIGKSPKIPMTEFSGGHGRKFDGNSFLLLEEEKKSTPSAATDEKGGLTYIYIGESIFRFRALHPICDYVSPVGNSDVPYPYAVDTAGNYYILLEGVVLKATSNLAEKIKVYGDPCSYYYAASLITPDAGCIPPRQPLQFGSFDNPLEWTLGGKKYTMKYCTDPEKNFDRISADYGVMKIRTTQTVKTLSKAEYAQLIRDFADAAGLQQLNKLDTLAHRL